MNLSFKRIVALLPVVLLSACANTQLQQLSDHNAELATQLNYLKFENAKLKENQTRLMRQQVQYRLKNPSCAAQATVSGTEPHLTAR